MCANFYTPPASPARNSWSGSPVRRSPGGSYITGSPGRAGRSPGQENSVVETYSDRFIPSRAGSRLEAGFALLSEQQENGRLNSAGTGAGGGDGSSGGGNPSSSSVNGSHSGSSHSSSGSGSGSAAADGSSSGRDGGSLQPTLNMLLRSELLGAECVSPRGPGSPHWVGPDGSSNNSNSGNSSGGGGGGSASGNGSHGGIRASPPSGFNHGNLFRFKAPLELNEDPRAIYDLSPVGQQSTRLLLSPRKAKRKIPKVPFKVLDAPQLQDDFYLNLVDWSALNVLAVGLGPCVYLWSACTSKVTKLCDLGSDDCVTSVAWTQRGTHLAVGTNAGLVELWDVAKGERVRTLSGHAARVGTLAWNAHTLASGSRDRSIFLRDVRAKEPTVGKRTGHKQEVCGLKWSFDAQQLASGGNDNKLFIWSVRNAAPVARFQEHTAAVKAIAWSPYQHGLLASGGGTADRCIRFWNTLTSTPLSCVDTGSQVCNLMWSKTVNEIVSTHGYSLNQIIVWKYPSMTKVATLTGHTYRVLYLAMSPDGQTIVTGAGDETLRFWNAFPGSKARADGPGQVGSSLLNPPGSSLR